MTDKLLPCPFCDSTDVKLEAWEIIAGEFRYQVICICGAFGPTDLGRSGAVKQWNTRPREGLPDSIQEALNSGDGTYRP